MLIRIHTDLYNISDILSVRLVKEGLHLYLKSLYNTEGMTDFIYYKIDEEDAQKIIYNIERQMEKYL